MRVYPDWYPIRTPFDWPKPWEPVLITVQASPSAREVMDALLHPAFGWMGIVSDAPIDLHILAWAFKPFIEPYEGDVLVPNNSTETQDIQREHYNSRVVIR